MFKNFIILVFLFSLWSPLSSFAWGYQPAPQGFNPAMGYGAPTNGFNPLWGGGYNLNSMMGNGGWGGFPAGYGFGGGAMPANNFSAPAGNGGCPGGAGGVSTGGFGGYYSPFIGGY